MIASRRALAAGLVIALAAAAVLMWRQRTAAVASFEPDGNMNVLLVTIDTLRADALSAYGGRAHTPALDRLAAEGVRFTFAHAHSVVTLPSHTTILTGRLPYEHGIRDNAGFRVAEGTATLATRLKAAGFATAAFVGGFPLTKRFGLTPGFDIYDDQMPEMSGAIAVSLPERPADVVSQRAADWIAKQSGRFFGWVHVFDAHSPYKPPVDLASTYADAPYFGEVAFIDRSLAPLFDRLRALSRPTLVIVAADHGESLGEHGEETHGMFAYEGTLRVPLIMARVEPGDASPAGRVVDAPVRLIDIAPTVLELTGQSVPDEVTGRSLRPLIAGANVDDRPTYFEAMTYNLVRGWAPLRGVITGREKYISLPIEEVYDLAADPSESSNRATGAGERLPPLRTLLKSYDTAPPRRPGQESAEVASVLRSLGYVSGTAPARDVYTEEDDPKRLVQLDRDLHAATTAFQDGGRDRGIALLEGVIARRKDTADAYIALAYAHWEAGDVGRAIETLEGGLRNGAPDRDIRIRLGVYLSESGIDPRRAVALLDGLPAGDAEAQNALGVALTHAGKLAAATDAFNRVLALDPTNGLALQNLGSIALRQALDSKAAAERDTRLEEAERLLRRALDADAALAEAHTTLGVLLSTTGRKEQAVESWKRAVTLDGAQFNALFNLWLVLAESGRHDEAVRYGQQFVATAPRALFADDIARIRPYLAQHAGSSPR